MLCGRYLDTLERCVIDYEQSIESDARFSLADALADAEQCYTDAFLAHWNFSDNAPPHEVSWEDWSRLREWYELARKLAHIAASLVKRKGVGPERLGRPGQLLEEAVWMQTTINQLLGVAREELPPEKARELVEVLQSPWLPSDPRTQRAVFENALQIEASQLFVPDLADVSS